MVTGRYIHVWCFCDPYSPHRLISYMHGTAMHLKPLACACPSSDRVKIQEEQTYINYLNQLDTFSSNNFLMELHSKPESMSKIRKNISESNPCKPPNRILLYVACRTGTCVCRLWGCPLSNNLMAFWHCRLLLDRWRHMGLLLDRA